MILQGLDYSYSYVQNDIKESEFIQVSELGDKNILSLKCDKNTVRFNLNSHLKWSPYLTYSNKTVT